MLGVGVFVIEEEKIIEDEGDKPWPEERSKQCAAAIFQIYGGLVLHTDVAQRI